MSTDLAAARISYVPSALRATSQHIKCKTGDAEAWIWTSAGKLCAVGFFGRRAKPYSGGSSSGSAYSFRTQEQRRAWIAELFRRATAHQTRRSNERAEAASKRDAGHPLKLGDVLRSSLGYDQTNIDYYQVTAVIGKCTVEVREIAAQSEPGQYAMTGKSVPAPGQFVGPAMRRRVGNEAVRINSCQTARLMRPVAEVAGVKMYESSDWTAYA